MDISSISNNLPVSAPAEPTAAPVPNNQRALIQAVKAVNAPELFGEENELTFVMDRQSRRMLVRIVNRQTGKIVDQIPPEYVLNLAEETKGR